MALLLLVPFLLLLVALFATMLRVVFRLGVALAAALLAAWLMPGDAQGWLPVAVFVAALALLSLRRRPARRSPRITPAAAAPARTLPTFVQPGAAWRDLRRLADWRTRRRLDAAWDACSRYLLLAETHEGEDAQLPIKVRKHLPAMVADCARHCRTASPAEQRALIAETADTIEALATRADARRRDLAHTAQGDFRTLKAHLTTPEE